MQTEQGFRRIRQLHEHVSSAIDYGKTLMGGPGSGNRWRYGAKSTTEDYRTLDVRRLAREVGDDEIVV